MVATGFGRPGHTGRCYCAVFISGTRISTQDRGREKYAPWLVNHDVCFAAFCATGSSAGCLSGFGGFMDD